MSHAISYTLVSDGSSDQILMGPIRWLLDNLDWLEAQPQWADLDR